MSLFLKQLKDIDFDEVKSFYETYSEGVRVEYKRDLSSNIPKVVSSFANTQGGILMIGIEEDRQTRSRKLLPLSPRAGYKEQITQACLMGINPPILPAIRVLDVSDGTGKVIIVVKVNQSVEAPHAIENSTHVYVRTGNLSQPYQLSDMSTLEYLFKRRQNSELKRESIIATAVTRSKSETTKYGFTILVCPTFPSVPLRSLDEIEDFVANQQGKYPESYFCGSMRRIQDGMLNTARQHFELSKFGLVFHAGVLEVGTVGARGIPYTPFQGLVSRIAVVAKLAHEFVQDTVTNLLLRVVMFQFIGVWLEFRLPIGDEISAPGANYSCFEDRIAAETTTTIEGLGEGIVETITSLTEPIIWSFNRREPILKSFVGEILKKNRQHF